MPLTEGPCVEGFGAAWFGMDLPTFALVVRESLPIQKQEAA